MVAGAIFTQGQTVCIFSTRAIIADNFLNQVSLQLRVQQEIQIDKSSLVPVVILRTYFKVQLLEIGDAAVRFTDSLPRTVPSACSFSHYPN